MSYSIDRHTPLEMWAGVECTVNRVGDTYRDQLELNGHAARREDLDAFAALGIRAIRYPVLWERTQPHAGTDPCWSWPDERLHYLRALRITPIVGLLHHGSGPSSTSLVDPTFGEKLAAYAHAVATRYPWVESYTPVNEPLTTARFSGLYGHWYPHGRDALTFLRALLNQCRGVVLAMQAVRRVNSEAKLIQTDDLGKTFSTPALAYQADYENERRWLTWDLLCGRVDRRHVLWDWLREAGVTDAELGWFLDHPCPPDIIGVNYYVTSERLLDERLERYPGCSHGGNLRHRYADVEAVRARARGLAGLASLLGEVWERYRRPIAVTEVHLGCTREEQMRWLLECWQAAQQQRALGIDVRAVTAWSLLGAFDWDSLLTRPEGHYEPGAFDVRSSPPRPTALARLVHDLAREHAPDHPVLAERGWWRRPERLAYPATETHPPVAAWPLKELPVFSRPILVTGAGGQLASVLRAICRKRGLSYRLLRHRQLDIADEVAVREALERYNPWAVVNAAGYTDIDGAEAECERCERANVLGPAVLASACAERDIPVVMFSSALVFDGKKSHPYQESDACRGLNVYGRSQIEAETRVRSVLPRALVIRTGMLFGHGSLRDPVTLALNDLAKGRDVYVPDDLVVSPTYAADLADTALDLLLDGERGAWHLASQGACTPADLIRRAAELAGLDGTGVRTCSHRHLGYVARRPIYSALASERGNLLPAVPNALGQFVAGWKAPAIEDLSQGVIPTEQLAENRFAVR